MPLLGAGPHPPGHPLHAATGALMTHAGSAAGFAAGVFTIGVARANGMGPPAYYAGILVGLASVATAFMPAILRVVNWKIEDARARADLGGKVGRRLDVQDETLRRVIALIRATDRQMYEALIRNRAWMTKVSQEHGIPVPDDLIRHSLDAPEFRAEVDRLFRLIGVAPLDPTAPPATPAPRPIPPENA